MSDKIVVFVMSGCPGCEELKKDMEGNYEVCDLSNDEKCMELADKAGVEYVPSVVLWDEDKVSICELVKENGKAVAVCGDKKYVL